MTGRFVATLGIALTTFLVVAALLTELLSARIAFSALVGLPIGIVAGAVAGIATWVRLWSRPALRPVLLGGSAVGYAVLAAAAVSYSVPPARGFVSTRGTLGFAVVCGVAVLLLVRRYPDRVSE
ncbi:hypothetical protein SAMN04488066_11117 [Halorubrum aquaticum]|uniref:DUF8147 domain-containing protein n=1 Tax=Halorubrum aquaticum TaxID=387340 RepID=A0A1I3BBF4_9EURY|nr:hypothetical protein [Halorubrum aquaticum]SFH59406.1 hypothetical protein SAMN04488066_11117 [Halorubrum aquaticum]